MAESIGSFLKQKALGLWWLTLSLILMPFAKKYGEPIFDRLENILGKPGLMFLILFLLLSSLILLIEVIKSKKKKSIFDRLVPVKGKGYSVDPKTGEPACPTCTTKEKPVYMSDQGDALYCFVCRKPVQK